jgi:hypothetical protein
MLMLIASSALVWTHLQWLFQDRKKYVVLVCVAALLLSVLVDDITWFAVKSQLCSRWTATSLMKHWLLYS